MPTSTVRRRAESAQALSPLNYAHPQWLPAPAASASVSIRPTPFLKWAGGKRRLLAEIFYRFPQEYGTYWEPFAGGGAVFFGLSPARAVVSDINAELIRAYTALRDNVHGVISCLRRHVPTEAHFYRVRSQQPHGLTDTEAAARMIYLNHTCFNGLYRVNRRGEFNVSFGRYTNPTICDLPNLLAVSQALRGVDLRLQCVFTIEDDVEPGDLVYFDPPYDPVSATASFVGYTRGGFGREEQVRLAEMFARLANRGVHVVLSNADTAFVRSLYGDFRIDTVAAHRAINSRPDRRGPVAEVIISAGGAS